MIFAKRKKKPVTKANVTNNTDEKLQLAELEIRVIRSKRKSISLHIKPEGIILRAPLFSPSIALKAFALSKIDWLRKHYSQLQAQDISREYTDGESHLLFGQNITLRVISDKSSSTNYLPEVKELTIAIGPRVKKEHAFIRQQVYSWYKKTALEYLESRVPALAQAMQLSYKSIQVRDYKARWGSCSSAGNLSFNWRIFMAPAEVIDSVIVHELAHTKHFNHSKQFWNLVYANCPDYKNRHAWLKENQYRLNA